VVHRLAAVPVGERIRPRSLRVNPRAPEHGQIRCVQETHSIAVRAATRSSKESGREAVNPETAVLPPAGRITSAEAMRTNEKMNDDEGRREIGLGEACRLVRNLRPPWGRNRVPEPASKAVRAWIFQLARRV